MTFAAFLLGATVTVEPPCACGLPRRVGQHNCLACNAAAQRANYQALKAARAEARRRKRELAAIALCSSNAFRTDL